MKDYRFPKVLKILLIVATVIFFFGFITMHLWNWLIPNIFGLTAITFWQAIGLVILSKILFGGIPRHGGGRSWRRHMQDRLANMTPEERERFRSGMHNRRDWCPAPPPRPPANNPPSKQGAEMTPQTPPPANLTLAQLLYYILAGPGRRTA